jgi:ABC-type phosphate/phosphonate transport system permease subunit
MVVSISSIDTLDLLSAILSAVGGGGIGAQILFNVIVTDKLCTYILLKIG